MIAIVTVLLIVILMGGSLYSFFYQKSYKRSYFSREIFYTMIIVYFIVLTSFGLLYFVLSFNGVLLIEGGKLQDVGALESLAHSLYFSGVTLMTVGYGDITPIGWGRLLALIEALIGYILPAAFFLKIWQYSNEQKEEETKELKQKHKFDYL
ncbi:two pore domain potassium channel family protein [Aquibacillus halophilus]|uniref:Two pore domain potassium channel family protein n=1 Tax=Aquibacillus halophilus TaxID=930132 RepID=A0A6A8DG53_9BACI|nr:potassium channel family protein [Aquibacillus halophilus]MRH44668.1 two pore domain potassium channel family protein [Aquibacillus halophilus]